PLQRLACILSLALPSGTKVIGKVKIKHYATPFQIPVIQITRALGMFRYIAVQCQLKCLIPKSQVYTDFDYFW
ncbi:MAG: hypothetical protein ACI9JR_003123, partial [Gammaproteobacteria bacterium]